MSMTLVFAPVLRDGIEPDFRNKKLIYKGSTIIVPTITSDRRN